MTRVAIVDDQTLVRQGIRSLLALSPEIEVVAEGSDGDEALAIVAAGGVDVLLLDLRMPRRDGIATLEAMRDRGDTVPVLVLTTFDDDDLVLRAVRAGARGYLLKDVTLDQLLGAVRTLASGGTLVQPALTDRLLRAVSATQPATPVQGFARPEPLTARELDVLRLVAAGYSNNEIASALHLAPGTVKNHVTAVLLKLGVRDRTRAVLRALELGVLETHGGRRGEVSGEYPAHGQGRVLMTGELAFFELGVDDAERGRRFYGELFGWTFRPGPSGAGGYLVETPGIPGGIHGGDPGAAPYAFFRVEDLHAAVARVRELGGSVEGSPDADADAGAGADAEESGDGAAEVSHGRFVLCRDDQGSPFGLFQPPAGTEITG